MLETIWESRWLPDFKKVFCVFFRTLKYIKFYQFFENRIQIIDQNQKTSKCYIQSESQGYDTNLNERTFKTENQEYLYMQRYA